MSASLRSGRRTLPPLSSLRAFEAAARHGSFTRAAVELNVTASAISHQMRILEAWLEVPLFSHGRRPPRLTGAGQRYFQRLGQAFDLLSAATTETRAVPSRSILSVATMDSFAANWLVGRLHRFRRLNETMDVRITLDDRVVDFARENVDVAIRYGRGHWPETMAELLFEDHVFPVCSPVLMKGRHPLDRLEHLRFHTLLHDAARNAWPDWLAKVRLDQVIDGSSGPGFGRSYLAIQAAINHEGVALASRPLVMDALSDGQLVRPFDESLVARDAYFLCYPASAASSPKVKPFRDWLFSEVVVHATRQAVDHQIEPEPLM